MTVDATRVGLGISIITDLTAVCTALSNLSEKQKYPVRNTLIMTKVSGEWPECADLTLKPKRALITTLG